MILCQLTNGFGNNLFQYNASIVLGKELDKEIFAVLVFIVFNVIKT